MPMLVQASMCERHPGLGNRMFPWARAEVFASRTGARMIERTEPTRFAPFVSIDRNGTNE